MKKIYLLIAVFLVLILNYGASALGRRDFKLVSTYYFGENTDYEYPAEVIWSDGGLVVAGRTSLIKFRANGEELWNKPLYAFGALCAASGSNIAVCERNSGEFYILDKEGAILHHSDQYGKIRRLKAFGNNSYGFQTDYGIHIYSGSSDKVYFQPSQPGDIIDFSYSDSHKKVAVIYLDSEVNCYINLLTVTGEITAGKIEQDGLVFDVHLTEDRITVLKDDGIYEYDYYLEKPVEIGKWEKSSEERAQWLPSEIYSYQFSDDILCGKQDGSYGIWVSGEKRFTLSKPAKECFKIAGGFLIRDHDVYITNDKGETVTVIANSDDILDVLKFSTDGFAVVFANRIEFYNK